MTGKSALHASGRTVGDRIGRLALLLVNWLVRHLLLLLTFALALYALLPLFAPVLMYVGHERAAKGIYLLFRPLCHQLPERSFFLFGPQPVYSIAELSAALGGAVPVRYIGDARLGYKMAVCQRDVAIYGSMFLAMVAYGPWAGRLRRWPLWALAVCAAPMAIDGGGQLVGLWQSSPLSRVLTGALFGVGAIRVLLPILDRGLAEARITVGAR